MIRLIERRWGHRRRGFSLAELRGLGPSGARITVVSWNEPFFRRLYLLIKMISLFSGSLACRAASVCASLDSRFPSGMSGRFFVRVEFVG
jgi:hypothetical protein